MSFEWRGRRVRAKRARHEVDWGQDSEGDQDLEEAHHRTQQRTSTSLSQSLNPSHFTDAELLGRIMQLVVKPRTACSSTNSRADIIATLEAASNATWATWASPHYPDCSEFWQIDPTVWSGLMACLKAAALRLPADLDDEVFEVLQVDAFPKMPSFVVPTAHPHAAFTDFIKCMLHDETTARATAVAQRLTAFGIVMPSEFMGVQELTLRRMFTHFSDDYLDKTFLLGLAAFRAWRRWRWILQYRGPVQEAEQHALPASLEPFRFSAFRHMEP